MLRSTLFLLAILISFTVSANSDAIIESSGELDQKALIKLKNSYPELKKNRLLDSPRFEGWYMRVTDREGSRSIAVIGGSFMNSHGDEIPYRPMSGYLAVLVSEGDGAKTIVYEAFPQETTYITNFEGRFGTKNLFEGTKFLWRANGYGSMSDAHVSVTIPNQVNFELSIFNRLDWNKEKNEGPEGVILYFPMVPIHWFVHSLGSDSNYDITYQTADGLQKASGVGYTHQEKNWGEAFPTAWIWSQGVGADNESQYALAGGKVDLKAVKFTSWLVGTRSKNYKWDYRHSMAGTTFTAYIDACEGSFKLIAKHGDRLTVIKATAPLKSFGYVSIPTEKGFQAHGGVESFSAQVTIENFQNNSLLERLSFKNAALEFGARYMCGGWELDK